jgi:hypothetical protein
MSDHPYNNHREQQVAHRRVGTILSGSPAGAEKHAKGHAFSKITSKSAASRDDEIAGRKTVSRFARGGRVKKGGGNTNIAIVLPKGGGPAPGGPAALPLAGPGGPPPPMGAPPPGMPPGPPGMPMRADGGRVKAPPPPEPQPKDLYAPADVKRLEQQRARGGKVIGGEDTKANNKKWSDRAAKNSYFTGGAITGVGREEKAAHAKRR